MKASDSQLQLLRDEVSVRVHLTPSLGFKWTKSKAMSLHIRLHVDTDSEMTARPYFQLWIIQVRLIIDDHL